MDGLNPYSLGSSYFSPLIPKIDNPDRDFKKPKKLPLPPSLRQALPFPETPWKISNKLFKQLQFPLSSTTEKCRRLELNLSDPETAFVNLLFNHSRPKNLYIRKIYALHNRNLTKAFEAELVVLENRSKNPFFVPNLEEETEDVPLRKRTLQRWQSAADMFSPIYLDDPRNPRTLTKTYVLPLWHGTNEKACESIVNDGFAISGSHGFKQGQIKDGVKRDLGYFGNGIYATNSAKYCSKAYAQEHMLLVLASMSKPFPVVADHPPKSFEDEPKDKTLLKGDHAYKRYTAHYIPVRKIPSTGKPVYYPCAEGQEPAWDEVVVFDHNHILPRFLVELGVELPRSVSLSASSSTSISLSSGHLLDKTGKVRTVVAQSLLAEENEEKERKKINAEPVSASKPLLSSKNKPEKGIRFLLSIPSSVLSTHSRQEQPIITGRVATYLDGRSAMRLLSSCSHLKRFSLIQALYAELLERDFPGLYQPLVSRVTKQPQAQQGLLWHRLYAMSQGPDPQPQVLNGHQDTLTCLIQLTDGRIASGSSDRTVRVWSPDDSVPTVLKGHSGSITCLTQLKTGRIASGSDDCAVRVWSLHNSVPTVLKGHSNSVTCLIQLADGRIASGSSDHTIRIWPLDNSAPTILKGHSGRITCLIQLEDGRIASGSSDNTVRIWFLDNSAPIVLSEHSSWMTRLTQETGVTCLIQLKDGRIASGSSDSAVRIWTLDDSPPTVLSGHSGWVTCLIQLRDGGIASGSYDNTVRIWRLDGSLPIVLSGQAGWLGYLTQLTWITFLTQLRDGRIAGSWDNTIRIWPLDGSAPTLLKGHTGWVTCLTQLADGRLASGSLDRTVRVWGKNASSLFQRAIST